MSGAAKKMRARWPICGAQMDYDKILARFAAYQASDNKGIHLLVNNARVTQMYTKGCQCRLGPGDIVVNFIENKVVGGLAAMLPPCATNREILDQVFLGDVSLASIIHQASDDEWNTVIGK